MKFIKLLLYPIFLLSGIVLIYIYFPEEKLPINAQIDQIIVYKSERKMKVYFEGTYLKTYKVSLGKVPIGKKETEGDKKTPEGIYHIENKNPNSVCYKNLGVSYPNATDRENAQKLNLPTGGDIKIHGLFNKSTNIGKFHRWKDWTAGCIAVTNYEMDELYKAVLVGAEITILP
jgi:murein L,D-transpeptidase YafK